MTTWRDLQADPAAPPAVPAVPTAGVPAPTPNWRDLAEQPPAEAPAPLTPQAPPPAPGPWAPGTVAGDQTDPGQAWETAGQLGATPVTPQPTAPSSVPVGDTAEANAAVGFRLASAGAAATDVDIAELLRHVQGLQAQVDALTAEQRQANAPDVVKYATAFADHLQAKADAHPVINADPDHTFITGLQNAAKLVNAAEQVAATGAGHESLVTLAKDAGHWVTQHARRFRAIDYDYLAQLAEEVGSAAVKLLA